MTSAEYLRNFRIAYADLVPPPGVKGRVVLTAVVGKDGVIQYVSPAGPAADAIRNWCFRPLKLNGVPVEVVTEIELNCE